MKKILFYVLFINLLFANETNTTSDLKNTFLFGVSASNLYWHANNKVKDDANSYGSVKYDIGNSLYTGIYFQGKFNNTQVALNYIQNKSEKMGENGNKVSKFIFGIIDFNSFFKDNEILRVKIENGEVNGIANWNGTDTNGEPVKDKAFHTKVSRISLLKINQESGKYKGIEYLNYKVPSLVGFSKDGDIKFVLFDEAVNIQKLSIDFGWDTLSYTKNNYTDYHGFYLDGLIGIGIAKIDLSNKDYAEQKAKDLGYNGLEPQVAIVIDYGLELGYIIQKKSKTKKYGFSTQIGMKVNGTYYSGIEISQEKNGEDDNKLSLDFERNDVWYGPFISVNLIF